MESTSCIIGTDSIDSSLLGFKCSKNHVCCTNCGPAYVEMMMDNPEANIPSKCIECFEKVPISLIGPYMTSKQKSDYNTWIDKKNVGTNLKIVECPNCSYYEKWFKTNNSHIFYCKNKSCLQVNCLVCYETLKTPKDSKKLTEEEEKELGNHEEGKEYKEYFDKILDTIDRNNQRYCPNCGLGGRKNDAGTHITCYGCKTRYCYIGGESEATGDKSNPTGNIFRHNDNWESNIKRCPLYFNYIGTIDPRWELSEVEGIRFLHEQLVYSELK